MVLRKAVFIFSISAACGSFVQSSLGQTPLAASAQTVVPALVPYIGVAEGVDGKPLAGDVSMTFLLFKDETGGEPLWMESQRVGIDAAGHYKVELGAGSPSGLPLETFASGEARWLEVQIAGQKPQPRTLLSTVPYAAKAADAATLGGLPASAYALVGTTSNTTTLTSSAVSPDAGSTVTTTGGTSDYLPKFTGSSTIANSQIYDNGTSVGIGDVPNPSAKLDINGGVIMRGGMTVSRTGNATASKGYPSFPFGFYSNAYNSSTKGTDNPHFLLQSEPVGNNTANTGATFNFLYSNHGTAPVETGLSINSAGIVQFAPGQTFPGSGGGTITGVNAGTALTGGGTSGAVTLNLDTTKVPLLSASNNFAGTQTITNGIVNLSPTTGSEVGSVYIGGLPFLHGYGTKNVFVGNAGNFSTSGSFTAGVGYQALASQTSGSSNTAIGDVALYATTSGSSNTAVGNNALFSNTTGSNNTAIGVASGPTFGDLNLTNTTAVGYGASVSQSNSLVLGQTNTVHPGTSFVNVGIGTAAPLSILEASQANNQGLGPSLTLSNYAGGKGAGASLDFLTYTPNGGTYNPASRIEGVDDGNYSENLLFYSNTPGGPDNGLQLNVVFFSNGQVGVGGNPANNSQLTAYQSETSTNAFAAYGATINSGDSAGVGGNGIQGYGGNSTGSNAAGEGAYFRGGGNSENGYAGDGMDATVGIGGATSGYAGYFIGDVFVDGQFFAESKDFKIDHPSDPANKYLYHASVESSEQMNLYTGNIVTDDLGLATVTLPSWFQVLNTDFRYQLTVMGQFAQAIIKDKIADGKFTIMTNAPHVEVSWQVTAVRQDAFAKAHPLVVERAKPARERGFYLHPEYYGQPEEKQTEWARHPERMKRLTDGHEQVATPFNSRAGRTLTAVANSGSHVLPTVK